MNLSPFKKFDVVQATDGKSMYLDFDLDTHLARLTLWGVSEDAGACDLEILNVTSEETELWEHQEFHDAAQFYAILTNFRSRLEALADRQTTPAVPDSGSRPFELVLEGKRLSLGDVLEPLLTTGAGR